MNTTTIPNQADQLEQSLKEIGQRNLQRAKDMAAAMGSKYLLHPANRVTRNTFKNQVNNVRQN